MTIANRPRALALGLIASAALLGPRAGALAQDAPDGQVYDDVELNIQAVPPAQEPGMEEGEAQPDAPRRVRAPGRNRTAARKAAEQPQAADPGEPSFARDVAPILVANCVDCHSPGRPGFERGKLDMGSFEKLVKGGQNGPGAVADDPDASHILLRVKGEEEPRMPPNNDAVLGSQAIAAIEGWIKAGAKLDPGLDATVPLKTYAASLEEVARANLARMAPEERDTRLREAGLDLWKKANPELRPELETTEHFAMFSTLPKERATTTLKAMESHLTTIRRVLGPEATEWPGKISFHVFPDRKGYVEFQRTVKRREAAEDEAGDADLKASQPYVAVIAPPDAAEEPPASRRRGTRGRREADSADASSRYLPGLLTEQLVRGAVLAQGNSPRWLAEGLGAYLASGVERRGGPYQKFRRDALDAFRRGWATKATEVLGGGEGVAAEEFRGVSFALVECLASPRYRALFPEFLKGMREGGEKLDEVVRAVYGVDREAFLTETGEWVAAAYGGGR
jgi:hypothetical protein